MDMSNIIDYDKFAVILSKFIATHQISVIELKKKPLSEPCWDEITTEMFGFCNKINKLKVFTAWRKNNKNIQNNLENISQGKNLLYFN